MSQCEPNKNWFCAALGGTVAPVFCFFSPVGDWMTALPVLWLPQQEQENCQSQRKLENGSNHTKEEHCCISWVALIKSNTEENPYWFKVNHYIYCQILLIRFQLFSVPPKNVYSSDTCCTISVITRYIKEQSLSILVFLLLVHLS